MLAREGLTVLAWELQALEAAGPKFVNHERASEIFIQSKDSPLCTT